MPHKVYGSKQTAYSTAAATIMNNFSKPQLKGSMLIFSTCTTHLTEYVLIFT